MPNSKQRNQLGPQTVGAGQHRQTDGDDDQPSIDQKLPHAGDQLRS
jgi:hypothetical protein